MIKDDQDEMPDIFFEEDRTDFTYFEENCSIIVI